MQTTKRKALGKGLKALIPVEDRKSNSAGGGLIDCRVDQIIPNSDQPRQSFDEQKLRELTESVRHQGILQPLVVRALTGEGDKRFQIVAGERRWRAAKLAGLKTVPVIVKELTDTALLEVALIENIQREDLNPLEEAEAYRQLLEEHGLTQEKLAQRVGRQRSTVANALRLLKLPEEIQEFLLTGELSMGHARALLGLDRSSAQRAMARKVVRERLNVRQCEEMVRRRTGAGETGKTESKTRKSGTSPDQVRMIESLQRRLGTKVELRPSRRGGKLVVHYYSEQELDHIVQTIEGR